MSFAVEESSVCKRKAFRIVRKWYKDDLGINIDKSALERIWQGRHETKSISEENLNLYLHDLAKETYEEIENDPDINAQSEATEATGL